MAKSVKVVSKEKAVILFSGDSGDGIQLAGTLFADTAAHYGNDLITFPDFPAEIRAPQGTVGGVSGFQIHFGKTGIDSPGDYADVLVAMNPAAIKANADRVKPTATIIYDSDNFTARNIERASYTGDPFAGEKLGNCNVVAAAVSSMVKEALRESGMDSRTALRTKNMFVLGMVFRLFDRKLDFTEDFFDTKFADRPEIAEANKTVLRAGYNYAGTVEALAPVISIPPASLPPGRYRNINGNTATAWGFLAAAEKAGLEIFAGSYPITPATGILEEFAARRDLGVKTFQAEDEIAGICAALGAAFAGSLAVTSTSGPGLALKSEAIGLAVMAELPVVIVNVQRGGPSTGLPTKTEQADLMQALYGRNGESPVVVLAAGSPSGCFHFAYEAARIALEHMIPVILLTDGYLANGSEPWRIPEMKDLPPIRPPFAGKDEMPFMPYGRNSSTLARYWAIPGTGGFEHHVGGLEKTPAGIVSYLPENHESMVRQRADKIAAVREKVADLKVCGRDSGDLLIVGWGGSGGYIVSAVKELQSEGFSVSYANFNYINPLPGNTREVFGRFRKIAVAELNLGQFASWLRSQCSGFRYEQINKVQGLPFRAEEIREKCIEILKSV